MKVLYHSEFDPKEVDHLRPLLKEGIDLIVIGMKTTSKDELIECIKGVKVAIGFHFPKEVLLASSELTNLIIPFTGIPQQDQELIKDPELAHITVSNSHFNAAAVAEQFFALLLAVTKRIVIDDQALRRGDWSSRYEEVFAVGLQGKTLGIIGFGHIGKEVALRSRSFGMRLMAIKRSIKESDEALKEKYGLDLLGGSDDLHYLLRESDFVLLSTPSTDDMKNSFGKKEFEAMKDTAYLINVARGSIIVEEDLYNVLKDKRIAGYAADVWFNYPMSKEQWTTTYPSDFPLHELDNVVMSPHRSYLIKERDEIRFKDIAQEINRIAEGKMPLNLVDKTLGY